MIDSLAAWTDVDDREGNVCNFSIQEGDDRQRHEANHLKMMKRHCE